MFELFIFFYILSVAISLILSWRFNYLTKKKPEKYRKLLSKIKEIDEENDKNDLNLFKDNKDTQNYFMFLSLLLFPFLNLFLCYILLNNIKFLNNKK